MLKELLELLPEVQRKQLMYAFENNLGKIIPLDNEKFIGVNIPDTDRFIIEESSGKFACGRIKK